MLAQDLSRSLPVVVATMYRFVHLPDFRRMREPILATCRFNQIKGTLILAEEGINGTIAGARKNIDAVMAYLLLDPRFSDLEYKESFVNDMPFYRMKVKLKKEIVTMGVPAVDPNRRSGVRVEPDTWNKLVTDPTVLVLDTRNQYEHAIGTFKNAVSPRLQNFSQFPAYVKKHLAPDTHKKIAMFCTGGIRCEKAASYLLEQGFSEIYHLGGGILKYLEHVASDENLWQGECFVFDGRVAVNQGLAKGTHQMCYGCRMPLTTEDRKSTMYEEGVSCPHCLLTLTNEKRARLQERMRQINLSRSRNEQHIGTSIAEKTDV